MRWSAAALFLIATAGRHRPLRAQEPGSPADDFATLDLDELARIRVTSASRKPEAVAHATAAIFVITREDLRRSGATSLPEALRLVPGLDVARVGTRDWAISARGFNQQSSNKLLVLVDGRAIYSPIFAGVFWDAVSVPFDEVDRIEVIRGPGATLWGSNAVNGVINVITRPASESHGGRLLLGGGSRERAVAGLRVGRALGAHTDARVYASVAERDRSTLADGEDAVDDWRFGQTGFRLDAQPSPANNLMVQGNAFLGTGGTRLRLPIDTAPYAELRNNDLDVGSVNLSSRWTHHVAEASDLSLQVNYDYSRRRQDSLFGTMTVHTAEAELQYRLPIWHRHDLLWGANARLVSDDITGATAISFDPAKRTTGRASVFLQDDITLVPNRFAVTAGVKIGTDNYTGFGIQPNARLLWLPGKRQTVWAAISHALRAGSRLDTDARAVAATPNASVEARLVGTGNFDDEELTAYEAGYRAEPSSWLAVDVALFYNNYDMLRTLAFQAPIPASPRPILPVLITNQAHGRAYGAETSVTVQAASWWHLRGIYSNLHVHTAPFKDAPATVTVDAAPKDNPAHQAGLWSSIDFAGDGEFDVSMRYVSALEDGKIPNYTTADVRLGWRWSRRLETALIGQDLLHERHAEFPSIAFIADQRYIERRVYGRVLWRF